MNGFNGIPATYDYINVRNAMYKPSTVHIKQTGLAAYFQRYLIQKIISNIEIEGMPDTWASNYVNYCLFVFGFFGIIETDRYGIIPQHCSLAGRDVMYQPNEIIVANPLLQNPERLRIGQNCALVKMQPDYGGCWDIVEFYADMMALSAESAAQNLVNSKLAYVFATKNKAGAESFKKMFDQIISGNPAAFVDKDLFNDDGSPSWEMFANNLRQNYIAGDILEDMSKWDARFNTEIGIPNVNIAKASGVSDAEVNANNTDTFSKAGLWVKTIREGLEQANKLYGLNLSVKLKSEVFTNGYSVNSEPIQLPAGDL